MSAVSAVSTVGVSPERTPGKHGLLNAILGKVVGAAPCVSWLNDTERKVVVIDMTAGDGVNSKQSGTCSPGIIKKHFEHPFGGGKLLSAGWDFEAHLFEQARGTFDRLNASYGDYSRFTLHNQSSSGIELADYAGRSAVLFIIADPNSISAMPHPANFYRQPLMSAATVFATLGCNVGGLKREPPEKREHYKEILRLPHVMRGNHDALLFRLDRDASQWFYMAIIPRVWSDEIQKTGVRILSKTWDRGVSVVSYRSNLKGWNEYSETVYKTNREIKKGE